MAASHPRSNRTIAIGKSPPHPLPKPANNRPLPLARRVFHRRNYSSSTKRAPETLKAWPALVIYSGVMMAHKQMILFQSMFKMIRKQLLPQGHQNRMMIGRPSCVKKCRHVVALDSLNAHPAPGTPETNIAVRIMPGGKSKSAQPNHPISL